MLLKACIKSEKEEKGMAWRPLGAAFDAANAARLRPCCRALQGAVAPRARAIPERRAAGRHAERGDVASSKLNAGILRTPLCPWRARCARTDTEHEELRPCGAIGGGNPLPPPPLCPARMCPLPRRHPPPPRPGGILPQLQVRGTARCRAERPASASRQHARAAVSSGLAEPTQVAA
jgi:hypothetical protein